MQKARTTENTLTCPSCRKAVHDVDGAELCRKCLALHHEACWKGSCGACGAHEAGAAIAEKSPAKKKPRGRRGVYANVKLVAHLVWLAGYLLALVTLGAALASGVHFTLVYEDLPFWLRAGLWPYLTLSTPVIVLDVVDAFLRFDKRRKAPLAVALSGFLTGGLTSFVYWAVWGRAPLDDEAV